MTFYLSSKPHKKWVEHGHISLQKEPLITSDSKIFTMGSCFAVEIRAALRDKGFDVYPKYYDIEFDPRLEQIGKLPERDNINHYDTGSIYQELSRATINGRCYGAYLIPLLAATFQDPCRPKLMGWNYATTLNLSDRVSSCIDEGLKKCDIVIITLGLTEAWINPKGGQFVCPDIDLIRLGLIKPYLKTYQGTLGDLMDICILLPKKTIIFTVSPIPLRRTYRNMDVVLANSISKSVLRAAVDEVIEKYDHAYYFPSYEYAMANNFWAQDRRHLTPSGIANIVEGFLKSYQS